MRRLACALLGHDWFGRDPRVCGRCLRAESPFDCRHVHWYPLDDPDPERREVPLDVLLPNAPAGATVSLGDARLLAGDLALHGFAAATFHPSPDGPTHERVAPLRAVPFEPATPEDLEKLEGLLRAGLPPRPAAPRRGLVRFGR